MTVAWVEADWPAPRGVRAIATDQSRHTVSDERGRYAFPNQDIGINELTAELPGF